MSTSPIIYSKPSRGYFRPRYVLPEELPLYGLPDTTDQSNILALVDAASNFIDGYCGRTDANGLGSLVYSTYVERLLLQARGRNIVRVSFKPMAVVTPSVQSNLVASANGPVPSPKGSALQYTNWYWTGCMPNTVTRPDGSVSAMIGASGRYGYPRRSEFALYPDLNYGMNLLQVASFFGGPPNFTLIDPGAIDVDVQTGEIWVPAGLYLSQYTELVVIYNAGFDPLNMPNAIKNATAGLVRNFLARGGGVTGIKSLSGQGMVNVTFKDSDVDEMIAKWLEPFMNIIAM